MRDSCRGRFQWLLFLSFKSLFSQRIEHRWVFGKAGLSAAKSLLLICLKCMSLCCLSFLCFWRCSKNSYLNRKFCSFWGLEGFSRTLRCLLRNPVVVGLLLLVLLSSLFLFFVIVFGFHPKFKGTELVCSILSTICGLYNLCIYSNGWYVVLM